MNELKNNIPVTSDAFAVEPALPVAEEDSVITETPEIDPKELEVAEKEAEKSEYTYSITFRKPVAYQDKIFTEITFDWDKLTGRDSLNIENELQALGKAVVAPAFSGEYLIRMAAKASDQKIGSDFFELLPLFEYNKIRSAGRSFLLKSE